MSWMERLVAVVSEDLVPLETLEDPEGPATARWENKSEEWKKDILSVCIKTQKTREKKNWIQNLKSMFNEPRFVI